ncbi:hypothetical protein F5Y04DRAFT_284305 [Hypomontagnella monticulosa]|nr:hypothetical protein F5Y04DRAFT_284305 [Hypomontagnella monticulosa]
MRIQIPATIVALAASASAFTAEIYPEQDCQGTPQIINTTECTNLLALSFQSSVKVTEGARIWAYASADCTNSATWFTRDSGCMNIGTTQFSWRGVD